MSHTPGPWRWEDGYIMDSQRKAFPVASVNAMGSIAETEANALLIAQAPAMLEALRDCVELLEEIRRVDQSPAERECVKRANDIIRKVTGDE